MRLARGGVLCLALVSSACGESSSAPSTPVASSVAFTSSSPASGVIVVPDALPYHAVGGVVLPPESGLISVGLTLGSARELPWAQLNVYLLTGDGSGYCGQNLPDSPTWTSLRPGWTTAVTVRGFQIYQLPCRVTGIRAMLHTRDSGVLTPPSPAETIAEATLSTRFEIRLAQ
jgi:hypothetical protein